MKKILIPLVLLLLGTGGGVGAGLFLVKPAEEVVAENPCGEVPTEGDAHAADTGHETAAAHDTGGLEPGVAEGREYARLNNQFVVPVVRDGKVTSLVVLSLSLEVEAGTKENVFAHEPRLRDLFLQVLFDHANMGGFDGAFTSASNMRILRDALRHEALTKVGGGITDVLIIDIVRQDVSG